MERRPVFIDCDPGIDDAVALMMAFQAAELDVRGISAVAGNVGLERTLGNALKIVELSGAAAPVYAGADRPMFGAPIAAEHFHGEDGLLGAELPDAEHIPAVRFDEAKRLAADAYGYAIREPYDLEPEEEQHIGRYAKEVWGSDFVFVTHYPGRKRPFYTMDDPEDPRYTLSFDLLFRGVEITTGGQRIHNYGQQVEKLKARGMEPEDFSGYLLFHKHGAPPHGGLGIGLERLTMQLCGLDNIRRASLFPRDRTRLEP